MKKTLQFGIIGWPLTTTFSPGYFNEKFSREGIDAAYKTYPMQSAEGFPALLKAGHNFAGFNVTIPHKTAIVPLLDALSEDARALGAVNCIAVDKNGNTTGYNTDWRGFAESIKPLLKERHNRALIFGTGGASKAVAYALAQAGISHRFVSRTAAEGALRYEEVTPELLQEHLLLVNTTPLGMAPHEDAMPAIPYEALTANHLLYDVVYTPEKTSFLAAGESKGAAIKNGLDMFTLQAEASWKIWTENNFSPEG